MISIVTGTLNRLKLLPDLIQNTVNSDERLELVLVDGGSDDGTIEYIKELNHERIKLIEVGKRSYYSHFMNLGIRNSKFEWVCQWNDDVLLVNSWDEVIKELDAEHDFYLFNWKVGSKDDMSNIDWITGSSHPNKNNGGWCICDEYEKSGEIVMNYGIYNKKIFREIGMYRDDFKYYFADGDMSRRAHLFEYKHKGLTDIKVCCLEVDKRAEFTYCVEPYGKCHEEYKGKILKENIEFL